MRKLLLAAVGALAASATIATAPARATSLVGQPQQVNVVPASGFYQRDADLVFDVGGGRFLVAWGEDTVNDFPDKLGNSLKVRGFKVVGSTLSQFKPVVRLDQPTIDGNKRLLGAHTTPADDLQVLWSTTDTNFGATFTIYRQVFKAGAKSGGIATLAGPVTGGFARFLGNRSDGVDALIWRTGTSYAGKLLTAAGALSTPVAFSLPSGQSLFRLEGHQTGYVATVSKSNAAFTQRTTYGRHFNSSMVLSPQVTTILPQTPSDDNPFQQLATRGDGKIAFVYGLMDATNKVDVFGRVYDGTLSPVSAKVAILANQPDIDLAVQFQPLANGELLMSRIAKPPGGFAIVVQRLDASLHLVGTPATIGPFPAVGNHGLDLLANGMAVVSYSRGTRVLFIQMLQP